MRVRNRDNVAMSSVHALGYLPFILVPVALAVVSLVSGCEKSLIADKPAAELSEANNSGATDGKQISDESEDPSQTHSEPDTDATPKVVTQAHGEVEVISFDDLNIGMQEDTPFRPRMLNYDDGRTKRLLGKRINVGGYMNPTDTQDGVEEFILLKNLDCKFGPGGQADHLVHVVLQEGKTTSYTDAVIYVEGVLELNPFPEEGPTWSIYDLKATKISKRPPPRQR